MKLNVGCGFKKLSGYINIDADKDVKPDFVMNAYDLDFDDEKFNEILASQVIEHLGFFKTKYFLSESSRVLKKDKFLIIETPHIEKSFELFLKADTIEKRERILNWIYGSETEYMTHIYCFPVELMRMLLNEFNFEISDIEYFDYEYLRPAVRYRCIKRNCNLEKSYLRKNLVKNGVFSYMDEIYLSEFEKLIKEFDFEKISPNTVINMVFTSSVFSYSLNLILKQEDENIFKKLVENNFNGWIFDVIMRYFHENKNYDLSFKTVKKMFFDNPMKFIYNFTEKNLRGSLRIPVLNENTFRYVLNKYYEQRGNL
jgi:ubiquinone/menaquinone biosynthesis C-methylase UbiE